MRLSYLASSPNMVSSVWRNGIGHFRVTLRLCFKTNPRLKPLYENEFDLHENELVGGSLFCMKIRFDTEVKGNSNGL